MTIDDELKLLSDLVFRDEEEAQGHSDDKEWFMGHLVLNPFLIQYASLRLRGDKDVMTKAIIRGNSLTLYYASDELKNDKELVLKALNHNPYALAYASLYLRHNVDMICEAVKREPSIYEGLEESFKRNKKIILTYFNFAYSDEKKEEVYKGLPVKLKYNEDILLSTLKGISTPFFLQNYYDHISVKKLAQGVNVNPKLLSFIPDKIKREDYFIKGLDVYVWLIKININKETVLTYALKNNVLNRYGFFISIVEEMVTSLGYTYVSYETIYQSYQYYAFYKDSIFIGANYQSLEMMRKQINNFRHGTKSLYKD